MSIVEFCKRDYPEYIKDSDELMNCFILYKHNNYEMPKKEEYDSAKAREYSKIAKLEMELHALKETESKLRSQLMSANLKIAILEIQNGKKAETITTHNFNKQKDNNKYKEDELNSLAYDEFMKGL